MRLTLSFLLCLAAASVRPALGQQAPTSLQTPSGQYEYALLVATNGSDAILDYGQSREVEKDLEKRSPTTEQETEAVVVRKLDRAVLALNYLSSRGWECLGLSSRPQSSGNYRIFSATEYLLRRRRP